MDMFGTVIMKFWDKVTIYLARKIILFFFLNHAYSNDTISNKGSIFSLFTRSDYNIHCVFV